MEETSRGTFECLHLLGRPTLNELLELVRSRELPGMETDEAALIEEWRTASEYLRELETVEAGYADHVAVEPLPASIQAIFERSLRDPVVEKAYRALPHRWR